MTNRGEPLREIRIGLVGAGLIGRAHAAAYKNMPQVFGKAPAVPVLEMIADIDRDRAEAGAENMDFRRWSTDWRELVNDPAIDAVDIAATNNVHAEIAIAAANAGKRVYCEKPLAMDAAEARGMVAAAEASGLTTLVGFNYLKLPALGHARELVGAGELGEIMLFRGTFDQDVMTDPTVPFNWRHDAALAGTGALGDMTSHVLSIAKFLVGDIAEVCAAMATLIEARPVAGGGSGHTARAAEGGAMRRVENDDMTHLLARFENGAMGAIGSSRIGTGRKHGLTIEVQGTKGSVWFTLERLNELNLYRHTDPPAERGYKLVQANPGQPAYGHFHPIPGVSLGADDSKLIEARAFVEAVAAGAPAVPDFRFGLHVVEVMDAVAKSAAERRWVRLSEIAAAAA